MFFEVLLIVVVKGGILELERWYGLDPLGRCEKALEQLEYIRDEWVLKNTWADDVAGQSGIQYACVPSLREFTEEDRLKDLSKTYD